jgi:ribosomal protein L33
VAVQVRSVLGPVNTLPKSAISGQACFSSSTDEGTEKDTRSLSTMIFRDNKVSQGIIADFMHKIFDKSLPTRKRIHNNIHQKNYTPSTNTAKKQRIERIYINSFCPICKKFLNIDVVEDTEHIFTNCPFHFPNNDKFALQLVKIVNTHQKDISISSIPFWFSTTLKYTPITEAEISLSNFPKTLGDMGYIPKALKEWTKEWIPKDRKSLIKKLVIATQTYTKQKWINRCTEFFKVV